MAYPRRERRLYSYWFDLRQKVTSKTYVNFDIHLCPEWAEEYPAFRDWACAQGYRDHLMLWRRDVWADFTPANCYWAEGYQQPPRRVGKWDGGKRKRLYNIWKKMWMRCRNPDCNVYRYYGGRGIAVCPEWEDFEAFRAWAEANGYRGDLSLDRVDVEGDYGPSNCRWATRDEQARNTRRSINIVAFGETKVPTDWSRDPRCKVSRETLKKRLSEGWNPEKAITTPGTVNHPDIEAVRARIAATPLPAPHDEVWLPVPGWDAYEVSDCGRVRSCHRPGPNAKWRVLKTNRRGPPRVNLCNGIGRGITVGVARLVLTVHVEPPGPGMEACHFPDPNPANCRLDNLRWDTRLENERDKARFIRIAQRMMAPPGPTDQPPHSSGISPGHFSSTA